MRAEVLPLLHDPVLASQVVEACVANHFRRVLPTYYIKAQAEVDIAYVRNGRFWPVEIKWTNQLTTEDAETDCPVRERRDVEQKQAGRRDRWL